MNVQNFEKHFNKLNSYHEDALNYCDCPLIFIFRDAGKVYFVNWVSENFISGKYIYKYLAVEISEEILTLLKSNRITLHDVEKSNVIQYIITICESTCDIIVTHIDLIPKDWFTDQDIYLNP